MTNIIAPNRGDKVLDQNGRFPRRTMEFFEALELVINNLQNGTTGAVPDTTQLRRLDDDTLEEATTGVEYYSPNQHGNIYGTVVRQYFTTSLPGDLTAGNNVADIIDFWVQAAGATARIPSSGHSYISGLRRVVIALDGLSGANNLILTEDTWTLNKGWVDYIKA